MALNNTFLMQAPKTFPPAAKQALVLKYLRSSNTTHTLKELEKVLPNVASINGIQVKEYMQSLSDEGQIRVEKIGSGNWYWSFLSEEKRAREYTLAQLKEEKIKIQKCMEKLKEKVEAAGHGKEAEENGEDGGREELLRSFDMDKSELDSLETELGNYKDGDPEQVVGKSADAEALKLRAAQWTDNIYCLEEYLREVTGGNLEAVEGVRRACYGSDYIEGQGLRELS
ncbi:hypothetical protein MMC26_007662 [Xylographa opegraphella]|nr:hypothetical protein [Xylographa opegraphella]